jgi:hypothetical protein
VRTKGNARTKEQILHDRAVMARLYLQGVPQYRIAEEVGVSPGQVTYDLKKVRAEWRTSALIDFNERQALELAKLDRVEAAAWESFDRSRETFVSKTFVVSDGAATAEGEEKAEPASGGRSQKTIRSEGRHGDARFLQVVLDCVEKRCRILGISYDRDLIPADTDGVSKAAILLLPAKASTPEAWALMHRPASPDPDPTKDTTVN